MLRAGSVVLFSTVIAGMRENLRGCLTVKGLLLTHATRGDWQVCAAPVIPVIAPALIFSEYVLSMPVACALVL